MQTRKDYTWLTNSKERKAAFSYQNTQWTETTWNQNSELSPCRHVKHKTQIVYKNIQIFRWKKLQKNVAYCTIQSQQILLGSSDNAIKKESRKNSGINSCINYYILSTLKECKILLFYIY